MANEYKVIKTYSVCLRECGSQYQVQRAVETGSLFKVEEGVYAVEPNVPEIALISAKYPNAIIAGEYAFYYHGFTDVIPEKYSMATKSKAAKISDPRVFQIYVRDDLLELGAQTQSVDGYEFRIYDRERMLIELLRNKNTMPYDLYKEILLKYRGLVNSLELWRIQEYAEKFPKSKMIKKALDEEVL